MKFRNLIFVLAIAFSAIFVGMLGTSYAYYVVSNGTKIDVTTGNIDTGVAVVFEQSQYININTGIPIKDSMIDDYAGKSLFNVTANGDIITGDALVTIGITDLFIDDGLKVEDFKYDFSCVDGTTTVISTSGNGITIGENTTNGYLKLGSLSTNDTSNPLTIGTTYTCSLRVWLQDNCDSVDVSTCENQNHLMNKKFRGLIKVNTLFRNE